MTHLALRLSGLGLVVGAVLFGLATLRAAQNPSATQTFTPGTAYVFLLASALLLLSLPGMYARQAQASGWLGLAGYVLLQIGILVIVLVSAPPLLYPSFREPMSENLATFVLGICLTLGLLLTAVATIRAGVFPRWPGILLLLATAGFFFVFFVAEFLPARAGQLGTSFFGVMLVVALSWIGLALWSAALPALARAAS